MILLRIVLRAIARCSLVLARFSSTWSNTIGGKIC
jgi:hypothetical protein